MTELKTLKDLYKEKELTINPVNLFVNDLKTEAIKWVKTDIWDFKIGDETYCGDESIGLAIDWIKHFFNLTEEDLK